MHISNSGLLPPSNDAPRLSNCAPWGDFHDEAILVATAGIEHDALREELWTWLAQFEHDGTVDGADRGAQPASVDDVRGHEPLHRHEEFWMGFGDCVLDIIEDHNLLIFRGEYDMIHLITFLFL